MHMRLLAQGDLLIERLADLPISGCLVPPAANGTTVVVHGEKSGHRHALRGCAVLYRDDALASDIPPGLYIGHVRIDAGSALLEHDEHAALRLPEGTYRVRRQRLLEPADAAVLED